MPGIRQALFAIIRPCNLSINRPSGVCIIAKIDGQKASFCKGVAVVKGP